MDVRHAVLFSEHALSDFQNLVEWLAGDSPGLALEVIDRLQFRCRERLSLMPRMGPALARTPGGEEIRQLVISQQRVVYLIDDRADAPRVVILRVIHTARDLTPILKAI